MEAFDIPPASEAAQIDFFAAMLGRTQAAQLAAPPVSHLIELAGIHVRLNFSGAALRDIFFPALAHLEANTDAPPQAVFHIWDTASTGIDVPPPPCKRSQFTDRGDIWGFESERILSAFHWLECSVALMDTDNRTGIYWMDDAMAIPYWSKASPLRTLLHWVTRAYGRQLLHAAAVGTEEGGIIITGKGGVGKSTTSLLCLEAGLSYVGDDYVVVALEPEPRAYPLYCTAKLNPDQAARFADLRVMPMAETTNGPAAEIAEKTVFQLYPERRAQMPSYLKLVAIATPLIVPQPQTDFIPADPLTILRSASFTTLSHLPRAGKSSHDFIAALCQALPRLTLRLGNDLSQIPMAIRAFIANPPRALPELMRPVENLPLISVIIPAYNGVRFLSDAIASVIAQNYPALDIIIIDDGSTEDVAAAVAAQPVEIRYFRQDNAGPAAARNRGILQASGDYLAFLDIDDQWPRENLKRLSACLTVNQTADVVIGYGQLLRDTGANGEAAYIGNPAESFPYAIGAALFRRGAFGKIGLFDPELRFGEDTDWFQRADERRLGIQRLPETTLLVRRHETNMTRGKSLVELNLLKVFKKKLDRVRNQADA